MKNVILNKDFVVFISYKHKPKNWLSIKNLISCNPFFKIKSVQMRLNASMGICDYYSALFCLTTYPFRRPSINLLQVPSPLLGDIHLGEISKEQKKPTPMEFRDETGYFFCYRNGNAQIFFCKAICLLDQYDSDE